MAQAQHKSNRPRGDATRVSDVVSWPWSCAAPQNWRLAPARGCAAAVPHAAGAPARRPDRGTTHLGAEHDDFLDLGRNYFSFRHDEAIGSDGAAKQGRRHTHGCWVRHQRQRSSSTRWSCSAAGRPDVERARASTADPWPCVPQWRCPPAPPVPPRPRAACTAPRLTGGSVGRVLLGYPGIAGSGPLRASRGRLCQMRPAPMHLGTLGGADTRPTFTYAGTKRATSEG